MSPDAIIAAAARIEREWGASGYSIERVDHGPGWGSCTLHVVCGDGSRFKVSADRYGNRIDLPDEEG